ncbi:hypothetical protein HNP65_001890 [Thermosipho japonicus]|uniref:Uncharacterized protein n=1 Tax=Thermosipho japonicus TaxID=90323 RepID=A0A841GTT6_9BACT|nr:hypothetical protein [Thermosipho japonicus]MBB6063419.1 hypothetical protein [Thermosipho japonicus]
MKQLKYLTFIFLLLLFSIALSQNAPKSVHTNSLNGLKIEENIKIRVFQWIDITIESTPIVISQKNFSKFYCNFKFLEMNFHSNADVKVEVQFLSNSFNNELGELLNNFIIFFSRNNSCKSYYYITLEDFGVSNINPCKIMRLPKAKSGKFALSLKFVKSDFLGQTKAGIYKLPIKFTFSPTVKW